ncbi:MAG TPA: hypothetical protein DCL21_05565 [Alphaproteobacteria bacterium]|nr:hypothetical protein [Alphaproteobacteria bacterium]
MKKIMLLSNNPELVSKIKATNYDVLAYDDFMTVFEQLNFHNPDMIVFDFNLIDYEQQFMLESLPKKSEANYIKLVAIGKSPIKERMADFALKFENAASFNATVF